MWLYWCMWVRITPITCITFCRRLCFLLHRASCSQLSDNLWSRSCKRHKRKAELWKSMKSPQFSFSTQTWEKHLSTFPYRRLLAFPTSVNKNRPGQLGSWRVAGVVEGPKLSAGSNLGFTAGPGPDFNPRLLSSLCWRGCAEAEVQHVSSLLWCGSTKMIAFK